MHCLCACLVRPSRLIHPHICTAQHNTHAHTLSAWLSFLHLVGTARLHGNLMHACVCVCVCVCVCLWVGGCLCVGGGVCKFCQPGPFRLLCDSNFAEAAAARMACMTAEQDTICVCVNHSLPCCSVSSSRRLNSLPNCTRAWNQALQHFALAIPLCCASFIYIYIYMIRGNFELFVHFFPEAVVQCSAAEIVGS